MAEKRSLSRKLTGSPPPSSSIPTPRRSPSPSLTPKSTFYIPSASAPPPSHIYAKSNKLRSGRGDGFWDKVGGGINLSKGENRVLGGLVLLGAVVRFWHLERPGSVVFDEVHFGGFANKYIQSRFFMDVHPPLAKLLITLMAFISGFEGGSFDFKDIGKDYAPDHVPYIPMRLLPATLGLFLIPVAYLTLRGLQTRPATALLGSLFIMFENGLITQSRFILLDSPLIFFTALTIFFWIGFSNENELKRDRMGTMGPFSRRWWIWLSLTGLSLGAVVSCKWVGLFTIATIGILTIVQLWQLLGDVRVPIPLLFRHFMARAICLIAIPFMFYLAIFKVHFMILDNSGEGDGFMSSEFQHTLKGHGMDDTYADVMIGSQVTLRHAHTQGGYLHSHAHNYPTGSKQQQITLYPHRDDNNIWLINNSTRDTTIDVETHSPPLPIPNHSILTFHHISTNKKLHSHDIRAPVTEVDYQNEVSAYGFEGFDGDANDHFILEIDELETVEKDAKKTLKALRTRFKLRHLLTGCYLFSHKVKLPDWGFEQQEVTCNKNPSRENGIWFIETNTHKTLPEDAKKVNYKRPGFFSKFAELQAVMWQTNAGLTDRHAYDSRPHSWPLLRRGINFWVKDHRQIYLIGNPFVWILSTLSVAAYFAVRGLLILRAQRGYRDFGHSTVEFYDRLCGFLVLGWFMHYFPFFLMSRQLFLHHYFPALYFSVLLAACVFDLVTAALKPRIRLQVGGVIVLLTVWMWYHFSPLTYAGIWTRGQCESAKWGKHWDFSCNDFHLTKAEYHLIPTPVVVHHPALENTTPTESIAAIIEPGRDAFGEDQPKAPKSSAIEQQWGEQPKVVEDASNDETTAAADPRQMKEVLPNVPAAVEATTAPQAPPPEVGVPVKEEGEKVEPEMARNLEEKEEKEEEEEAEKVRGRVDAAEERRQRVKKVEGLMDEDEVEVVDDVLLRFAKDAMEDEDDDERE